ATYRVTHPRSRRAQTATARRRPSSRGLPPWFTSHRAQLAGGDVRVDDVDPDPGAELDGGGDRQPRPDLDVPVERLVAAQGLRVQDGVPGEPLAEDGAQA